MERLPVDTNSNSLQCSYLGYGVNLSAGLFPSEAVGYVRVKNIGEDDAIIRYSNHGDSDGVVLSPGETEYFYIDPNKQVELVEGSVNIMY